MLFSAKTSYQIACTMAPKFAVILNDEEPLQSATALIKRYGLEHRSVPGVHIGLSHTDFIAGFEGNPQRIIDELRTAARIAIARGATLLVTGFAAINAVLAQHGIREVDGVPILDSQATVIRIAEMMVDFRKLGMPKPGRGPLYNVTHADIEIARKIYGAP